ncbi:Hsp70 family protein [Paradevosia shaoguanensis]|uniref:Hsp70 family protein n=1 Tax=Paradevosia shaoguanensis TaxID=1335043 RepID=UPI0019334A9C|nr:Hsp70 family protein [Paradevosia shaoguanensis]
MTLTCGLDFGTSNSTMGVAANGVPQLLALEDGRQTIPSAIFFSFEDDVTYFGRKALSEYVTGADGRIMRALKSVLGTSLINDRTRIKKHQVAFTDILGLFIAELKQRAETALDGQIEQVVVGRPVRFVDDDDKADAEAQDQLEAAVRKQGYRHVEFQFEPIAAALDYERSVIREELALVVDLGGGTSDFTVIRVSPERARATARAQDILATAGVHIGGTDFDRLLSMGKIMPMLGYQTETADHKRVLPSAPYYDLATWHRINRLYNPKTLAELRSTRNEAERPELVERMIDIVENRLGHRLGASVEEAKIGLSDAEQVRFAFAAHEHDLETEITRADFDAVLENSVARIKATIDATLQLAGIEAPAIETLILTGGSTLVPAIVAALAAMFPKAQTVRTDVLGSVGLGLALDASRRFQG